MKEYKQTKHHNAQLRIKGLSKAALHAPFKFTISTRCTYADLQSINRSAHRRWVTKNEYNHWSTFFLQGSLSHKHQLVKDAFTEAHKRLCGCKAFSIKSNNDTFKTMTSQDDFAILGYQELFFQCKNHELMEFEVQMNPELNNLIDKEPIT